MGRSLLLRLEAPSQAWDAHRFHATMSRRPLSRALDPAVLAPTRTGIEGLLRAALGDDTDLSGLDVVVRADQEGRSRVARHICSEKEAEQTRDRILRASVWVSCW